MYSPGDPSRAATDDTSGGVLVRAEGLNADRVRGSMYNTDIPELLRLTLFGNPDDNAATASVSAQTVQP